MNTLLIFIWIYSAMIATSFWEAYAEGRNTLDKGKHGWKLKIGKYTVMTGYHFFLFVIMWPLLLILPLIIHGWDFKLLGILISAYASGLVIQDFMWYVVNPVVHIRELNTGFANYYPRVKIGKIKIPAFYFIGLSITFLSWLIIWQ